MDGGMYIQHIPDPAHTPSSLAPPPPPPPPPRPRPTIAHLNIRRLCDIHTKYIYGISTKTPLFSQKPTKIKQGNKQTNKRPSSCPSLPPPFSLTPAASAVLSEACWLRAGGSLGRDRLGFFDRLAGSEGWRSERLRWAAGSAPAFIFKNRSVPPNGNR